MNNHPTDPSSTAIAAAGKAPQAPQAPEAPAATDAAPSIVSPSLEFALRLARAQATLVRRLDQVLGGYHGISFGDFMLLHYLNRAPGGRLRRVDLAERQGLTASGVTRTLLPLEKIGLVERQHDPRDARVAYAAITATGRELLNNAVVVAEQISKDLLRSCPQERFAELSDALGLIAGMHASNS